MGVPGEYDRSDAAEDTLDGILRRLAEMARSQIPEPGPAAGTVEEAVRRIETRMAGSAKG